MESGSTPPDNRIPRGAIVIVVVGLLATLAAALLTTGKGEGEAAHLEWVQQRAMPDSKPVVVPGGKGTNMQLVDNKVQATGTNVAGYLLFRVVSTLKVDSGAPTGKGRIICSVHAGKNGTEIAQSSGGLRMTYPRSSEDGIYGQPVSETVTAEFASHGYELAVVEVEPFPPRFTTIQGVKVNWPKYQVGTEHIEYFLPEGKLKQELELPFFTVWRTQVPPAAKVSCELEVAGGKAKVESEGSLPKISPPINEEAEEEARDEREEAEEASGESEESEGE
jgi:hypothetical protein